MKFTNLTKVSAFVLAAVACYGAQAANNGITVSISPAKAVLQSHDDVVVSVKLTNNSGVDQYVLKSGTPFADTPDALFEVVRDGVAVSYVGRITKRAAPTASDYFVLKAGKSYTQTVELSALYDMSATGNYSIRYNFQSAHAFGGANNGFAAGGSAGELSSGNVSMWINGHNNVAKAAPTLSQTLAASLTYTNCSASRQTLIATAFSSAKTYASGALSYLNAGTKGARYTTWFGTYDATRYSTVKSHFSNISNAYATQPFVVDCSCTTAGTYAYVYPSQPYKIYVCGAFWNAPNTGTDSKAGTLVHETSHFTVLGGTADNAYGQSAAKSLAISSPAKAIMNADSHEYFAENNPAQN
jgi:peptidyl-Lys metalloendopeptidase